MNHGNLIRALFLDVGGVLLTNGWDGPARRRAVDHFGLDLSEVDERHHLTFDTYEEGKLSLTEYLNRVVFYAPRRFSHEEFTAFMFAQSQRLPHMIDHMRALKLRHGLKLVAVNNEGRELNEYRIREFRLAEFIDVFVSSSFVRCRKPDHEIYRIALDVAQVHPEQGIYIDDRALFVEIATSVGLTGIHHTTFDSTSAALARLGLSVPAD